MGCTNSIVPAKTPIQPPRLTSPLTGRITPKNSEVDRRRVLPTAPEACASVSGTECCFQTRETQSNSGRALAYTNSAFMESGTCGKIMFVHPRPRRKRFDSMIYFNRSFATSERDWRGQSGDNVEMRPQHATSAVTRR